MEYRIQYLRDRKGQPIGCVAVKTKTLPKKKGSNTSHTQITYQVSVLNPVDDFDRPLARQLALGRLTENPVKTTIMQSEPSMHLITETVMSSIYSCKLFPTRARQAAKLWLRSHSTKK